MKRKLAQSLKPTMRIVQEGDRFEVETQAATKTTKNNFTIGEEFEAETVMEKSGRVIIITLVFIIYLCNDWIFFVICMELDFDPLIPADVRSAVHDQRQV